MYELGLFVQDDWRVTSRLVLNLGCATTSTRRWSRAYDSGSRGILQSGAANGLEQVRLRRADGSESSYNNDGWVNLGPRVGFAYSLDGRGKTVVRGGFGVLYSPQMPGMVRRR
jgi:hypothetical protein